MQRKFLINLVLLVGINLLIKPLAIFGIDAEVQNRIGTADYGIYFSLLNFTYLFNILLDLGIINFNIRNVAQFPILSKRYIGKLLSLRILLFIFYTVVVFVIGGIIGFEGKQFNILLWLVINQFLLNFLLFFRSYFSGMLMFELDAFFSIFDRLLLIFFCGYFIYWNKDIDFTIYDYIFAQTFAYVIAILLALAVLLKKVGFSTFSIKRSFALAIFKQAFPFALLIFTMTVYTRSDAVLLERIHPHGDVQTGIYAQAYRILDACVMFSMLFNTLLFPIFSNLLAKKEDFKPILLTATKLIFTISTSVVLLCTFYAPQILQLLYDNLLPTSTIVFQILMLSYIPISYIQIFGTLHTAAGNLRFLNTISIVGIFISIGINLLLIPYFGAIGTAITAVITNSVIAGTQIIFTRKIFQLHLKSKTLLRSIFYFSTLLVSTICCVESIQEFKYNLIIFLMSAIGLSFLFKLVDIREIVKIIKTRE